MSSILPQCIRRPASPVARDYRHAGGQRYKVKDDDSWVTLAREKGMSPWELIRYNYPGLPSNEQRAAPEVNWYLQEYVGCTKLARTVKCSLGGDRRNFGRQAHHQRPPHWHADLGLRFFHEPIPDPDCGAPVDLCAVRGAR
jgi:hypothetical protein